VKGSVGRTCRCVTRVERFDGSGSEQSVAGSQCASRHGSGSEQARHRSTARTRKPPGQWCPARRRTAESAATRSKASGNSSISARRAKATSVRPGPPHRYMSQGRWHPGIHGPAFRYPPGFGYRRWSTGLILPPIFLSSPYYYDGYARAGRRTRPALGLPLSVRAK
jgi:hypothetical protein